MKTLSSFWNDLEFDYLKTYSGFRGELKTRFIRENLERIDKLKEKLPSARYMESIRINAQIHQTEEFLNFNNSVIINSNGRLHPTAIEISRYERESDFVIKLYYALTISNGVFAAGACPPIFRDVIVFFSKTGEIQSILNICFECAALKNEKGENLEVDWVIFKSLSTLLKEIGHPIQTII